jgi:hypothetical protein
MKARWLAALLPAFSGSATAAPIVVDYEGIIEISSYAPPGYELGKHIKGRLFIDPLLAPADSDPDPNAGLYASTPLGSTPIDFVTGFVNTVAESNDYVGVQNDSTDPANFGDSYGLSDRDWFSNEFPVELVMGVRAPGLFDNDHLEQSFEVTADDHPNFFYGYFAWAESVTEAGYGLYRYVEFELTRFRVTPGRCLAL